MINFEALCRAIIDSQGKPDIQSVLDAGYTMEHAMRLTHPSVKRDKLVQRAKECLAERGICYEEGGDN